MQNNNDEATLKKRLERERKKVLALEKLIEDKSRSLYEEKTKAERLAQSLDAIFYAIPEALLVIDAHGLVSFCNSTAEHLFAVSPGALAGRSIKNLVNLPDLSTLPWGGECTWITTDGDEIPAWTSIASLGDDASSVILGRDLRERKNLEAQLLQAQKLESVGQLAAGVAHEINTPIQFVTDSIHFLKESYEDSLPLFGLFQSIKNTLDENTQQKIEEAQEDADLEFVQEEAPKALQRCLEGLNRVASIVRAMKEFAHPDSSEKAPSDLNAAIENILVVAKNEYKYCADIVLDLGTLPKVLCHLGEFNQVMLNLIVNASDAIKEKTQTGEMGRITISTEHAVDKVFIIVEDSGGGIPDKIKSKIFNPFFTTKEVGKGTGQGLAIAYNIIVTKHNGNMSVENGEDGARFIIALPVGKNL